MPADSTITEDPEALEALFSDLFGSDKHPPSQARAGACGLPTFTDNEIIDHAMNAKNGQKFKALLNGNTGYHNDDSAADAALAALIAFWTDDEAQIESIMRRSQLARPKWDERRGNTTYLAFTISNINRLQTHRYTPGNNGNYSAALKREVPAERNNGHVPHDNAHHTDSGSNNSAGTTGTSAERKRDIFITAREVAESTPEHVEWVARPWIAIGGITEVDGAIKGGKTTWGMALASAVLDGADFMGQPTRKGPVVYLSEQPAASFREALRRAGLLERDDFYILFWAAASSLTWQQKIGVALAKVIEVGAVLLAVDTLAWWAGLRGDDENSSGAALTAMEPLLGAVGSHPMGMMVLRHDRKSGGEVGDSGRGSSAFGGSVDIVLQLKRPEGNPGASPTMRVIRSLSRFDETPAELMIELTEDGYVAHGDVHAVALATAKDAARGALKAGRLDEDGHAAQGLTFDELLEACSAKNVKRSTLQDALDAHCRLFVVRKTGAGKKGDPFRYTWIGD